MLLGHGYSSGGQSRHTAGLNKDIQYKSYSKAQLKNVGWNRRLLKMGIETQYKYKGQTQERQGVSFKIGNLCFKGSQVDRKFSFAGLEKSLALRQEQHLEHAQEQIINSQPESTRQKISPQRVNTASEVTQANHDIADKNLAGEQAKGLGKAIEISMTPEENHEHASYELLQEQRRRRKKQSHKIRR